MIVLLLGRVTSSDVAHSDASSDNTDAHNVQTIDRFSVALADAGSDYQGARPSEFRSDFRGP